MADPRTQRWLPFRNADSVPVPPFGAVSVTAIGTDGVLSVTRPTATGGPVLFNGRGAVAPGDAGSCTMAWPAVALCAADPESGLAPRNGESWGVLEGEFALRRSLSGFTVLGDAAEGRCNVMPDRASQVALLEITGGGTGGTEGTDIYWRAAVKAFLPEEASYAIGSECWFLNGTAAPDGELEEGDEVVGFLAGYVAGLPVYVGAVADPPGSFDPERGALPVSLIEDICPIKTNGVVTDIKIVRRWTVLPTLGGVAWPVSEALCEVVEEGCCEEDDETGATDTPNPPGTEGGAEYFGEYLAGEGTSSLTVTIPPGLPNGSLMLVTVEFVYTDGVPPGASITEPPGWTVVSTSTWDDGDGLTMTSYRIRTTGDTNFTFTATNPPTGGISGRWLNVGIRSVNPVINPGIVRVRDGDFNFQIEGGPAGGEPENAFLIQVGPVRANGGLAIGQLVPPPGWGLINQPGAANHAPYAIWRDSWTGPPPQVTTNASVPVNWYTTMLWIGSLATTTTTTTTTTTPPPCSYCGSDIPSTVEFQVNVGTWLGACTGFPLGPGTLNKIAGCNWQNTFSGVTVTATKTSATAWQLVFTDGVNSSTWGAETLSNDCCEIEAMSRTSGCTGPMAITLSPNCPALLPRRLGSTAVPPPPLEGPPRRRRHRSRVAREEATLTTPPPCGGCEKKGPLGGR